MSEIDDLILEWEKEIEIEAAKCMKHDGMCPSDAFDKAQAIVKLRRKMKAQRYERISS